MQQVLVKGGQVYLETVPAPAITADQALVQIHYSLISSGTESAFVSSGGTTAYTLNKARDPLNIEKLKRKLATVGVKGTLDVVRNKLFEFQMPGYSTSGVIVQCGSKVPGFRVGDRVACAGVGYATHSEYNAVPHALLTPLPDGVDFESGSFVALGAIAMQGVRRIQPTFGETIVILGLGLVGLLALQIARAAGCRVIGCDPIAARCELAATLGAEIVCPPEALDSVVHESTAGYGADAVVICAASKSSDIANQAIDSCRQRGRVAVVGAVGMDLKRAGLFRKEIDFAVSCSYGPGRYDTGYEEKGVDYPIGQVRWTEGRNMAEFIRLVAEEKVLVAPLIATTRPVEDAATAYKAVLQGDGDTIAALIQYAPDASPSEALPTRTLALRTTTQKHAHVGVAVVGAGAFAQAIHLPNLGRIDECQVEAVVCRTGSTAKQVGERFGSRYCTTDLDAVLADDRVDAVLIATRHHLHAQQVIAALDAGKHVFVEKPMALTVADCDAICAKVAETGLLLSVGYNRTFSPYAQAAKAALRSTAGPKQILYRCNAGALAPDHWILDPDQGGGRILGEAVHFFDFCCWMLDASPIQVNADMLGQEARPNDLSTRIRFADGSLATVLYLSNGHPGIGKEHIEIHCGGGSLDIDDFRSVTFHGLPGKSTRRTTEDKGQRACLENFIRAVQGKADIVTGAEEGRRATRIALEALASAQRTGEAISS